MMFNNNIIVLVFLIFICFIIHKTYSLKYDEQEIMNDDIIDSSMLDSNLSFDDQYPTINKAIDFDPSSFLKHPRFESPEQYFGWARKQQHPVEFLRGKRFWLFANKDEGNLNAEAMSQTNSHQNSLAQGLWRSGIVGRRRRR